MTLPELYRCRREFLKPIENRTIGEDILFTYAENVTRVCADMFIDYFGFKEDTELTLRGLGCHTIVPGALWRWYLIISDSKQEKVLTDIDKVLFFIDVIYDPPALCRLFYSGNAIGEYLRPYEGNDTIRDVLYRIDNGREPLFTVEAHPYITKVPFYYSEPRSLAMRDSLVKKTCESTRRYQLTKNIKIKLPSDINDDTPDDKIVDVSLKDSTNTENSTNTEDSKSVVEKFVIYEKQYVVPFCEICHKCADSLVQLEGSGFTLCHFCFDVEIKKQENVLPCLGMAPGKFHRYF